jgi:hypothetical protein
MGFIFKITWWKRRYYRSSKCTICIERSYCWICCFRNCKEVYYALGFSICDIGIITNIQEDHLGISDIHSLEDLAKVKACCKTIKKKRWLGNLEWRWCPLYQVRCWVKLQCGLLQSRRRKSVHQKIKRWRKNSCRLWEWIYHNQKENGR